MFSYNKKKLVIVLIYISFFITIPVIKNESRLIEKKIQRHESQIFFLEKNLLEASLEFEYLTSPAILSSKIRVDIFKQYALSDARKAHEDLEKRVLTGPVVLIP